MENHWLTMTDQQELFYRSHQVNNPHALVVILHGLAEHSGRYQDFAETLIDKGFSVLIPDHRGHGKTGEATNSLGYFAEEHGFERIVDDVNELIQHHVNAQNKTPIYLIGHSMGSFIARRFVQKYPQVVSKLVLVGTGGDPGVMGKMGRQLAKWKSRGSGGKQPGNLMNKLTFGSYNKQIPGATHEFDWLSTDPEVVKEYEQDSLCGFVSSNQLYVDLLTGLKSIHDKDSLKMMKKDLPVLLISGEEDPVGDYGKGVRHVANSLEKMGVEHVKLVLVAEERHEILNGKNRKYVYDEILGWLQHE